MSSDPHKKVDVLGIDNRTAKSTPVATVEGVVESTAGPVIVIMCQYACMGKGYSIHSSVQMEHLKAAVDDKSINSRGKNAS